MGALLLLLSFHKACGDWDVCLGLALLGCSCQPAPQLWACAPGHPSCCRYFPRCAGAVPGSQSRRGSRPTCAATIGSFIPSHPRGLCGK